MPFPSGGVYVAGNMVLDILVRPVERLPPWGTTAMVEAIEQHLGGNGAISAYTLGKLGAPVRFAGAVGDDAFGEYLLARLRSAGVDVSQVRTAEGVQTATTIGVINRRGERLFLHALGASGEVETEQVRLDAEAVGGFSYFHFASVFNLPKMRAAGPAVLERARAAGLRTSVDTMWDPTGRWMQDFITFCPHIDCLFLNQDEARMLAGTAEPATVGSFFRDRGVGMVVLKMAGRGCFVSAADEEFTVPAFDVAAVDTTGAGDSFCGGFLAAMRRGFSLPAAARFANAVSAHAVQRIGGADGVTGFEQTLEWMTTMAGREISAC